MAPFKSKVFFLVSGLVLIALGLPACDGNRPVAPGSTPNFTSQTCTGTLGSTAIDATVGTIYGASVFYVFASPATNTTLTNISLYSTSAVPVTYEMGIYSNNAGSPLNLLSQTGKQVSGPITGWNTVPLNNLVALSSGVTYWIACHSTNLNLVPVSSGITYFYQNAISTFGSLPAPAVGTQTTNYIFSVYGNTCP